LADIISDDEFGDDDSSSDESESDGEGTDEEYDGDHALLRTPSHRPCVNVTVRIDETVVHTPSVERTPDGASIVTVNEHEQGLTIAEAIKAKKGGDLRVSLVELIDDIEYDRSDRLTPLASGSSVSTEPGTQGDYFSIRSA